MRQVKVIFLDIDGVLTCPSGRESVQAARRGISILARDNVRIRTRFEPLNSQAMARRPLN
jgi:ribonucleotide monophosphatase NagD (HAD superfamily)